MILLASLRELCKLFGGRVREVRSRDVPQEILIGEQKRVFIGVPKMFVIHGPKVVFIEEPEEVYGQAGGKLYRRQFL